MPELDALVPLTLMVNGRTHSADVPSCTTLLDILRDTMNMTGTKKGCDMGACGACTVLADGRRINACLALAASYDGAAITTIEGVGRTDAGARIQKAWIDLEVIQCGYCQPGQIMSAAALLARNATPDDAEIDAAMAEGAASLMTMFYGLYAAGLHSLERGTNLLDSGSAIYDTYECADGRYISIAAIELKFREELFELLGLPYTTDDGPELRAKLEEIFKTRGRDEWCKLLEGTDACFAPVLTMAEAPHHPHNVARQSFVEIDGVMQPAPTPRFSRTPASRPTPPRELG